MAELCAAGSNFLRLNSFIMSRLISRQSLVFLVKMLQPIPGFTAYTGVTPNTGFMRSYEWYPQPGSNLIGWLLKTTSQRLAHLRQIQHVEMGMAV